MEIERKYLIKDIPFALSKFEKLDIKQGYISFLPTIRLRKQNNEHILTVKSKGDIAREEFELELTENEFNTLWLKTEGYLIEKYRYLIPVENLYTIELDIFKGHFDGLILAEVEFSSLENANEFIPPPWFSKDVTFLKEYKNSYMSKHGANK